MPTTTETHFINLRVVSVAFFVVVVLLISLFAQFTLLHLIEKMYLPLIPNFFSILLSSVFISYFFAKILAKRGSWVKLFAIGCLMALFVLISASLVYFFRAWAGGAEIFALAHKWQDYFILYGTVIAIQISILGLWAIPITGLAAVYYNKLFLPRLLLLEKNQFALEKNRKKTETKVEPKK